MLALWAAIKYFTSLPVALESPRSILWFNLHCLMTVPVGLLFMDYIYIYNFFPPKVTVKLENNYSMNLQFTHVNSCPAPWIHCLPWWNSCAPHPTLPPFNVHIFSHIQVYTRVCTRHFALFPIFDMKNNFVAIINM